MSNSSSKQQPLLTVQVHVFHINPETKTSWVPVTESAVPVSFFYDTNRSMYRIISVDGTKAVVNSCMRAGMNFTKTSLKFGQWTDPKSNAVYGLGFNSVADLEKFESQFNEIKEALQVSVSSPLRSIRSTHSILKSESENTNSTTDLNANSIYAPRRHYLNSSTNGGGSPAKNKIESPKRVQYVEREEEVKGHGEAMLRAENEKLRQALQQSSANSKLWEIELSNLKSNNNRLTASLQECSSNVEEWKSELEGYKRENSRLKQSVQEAQSAAGDIGSNYEELESLRKKAESLTKQLKEKEEEIYRLKDDLRENEASARLKTTLMSKSIQVQEDRNRLLLDINSRLASKLGEINEIQKKINDALLQ